MLGSRKKDWKVCSVVARDCDFITISNILLVYFLCASILL